MIFCQKKQHDYINDTNDRMKHEKSLVDYKFAEMAMSRRVDDIIASKERACLVLEHDNVSWHIAKTSDFKYDVNIPMYQTKRGGQTTYAEWSTNCT